MLKYSGRIFSITLLILFNVCSYAQFTHQDTLRGSNGPGRDWWNVKYYDLTVTPDYTTKTIQGKNRILVEWLRFPGNDMQMQIDLQDPMVMDSVVYGNISLNFQREGNTWNIIWPQNLGQVKESAFIIYYHG